jgi:hypothetical protein
MQAHCRTVSKDLIVDWIWLPPRDLRLLIINELYKFYLKMPIIYPAYFGIGVGLNGFCKTWLLNLFSQRLQEVSGRFLGEASVPGSYCASESLDS